MSWDEPHFEFRIDPYLIRIMSTGRAPIGKYNLIHITDSSTNDYVTDLWKSEDTGEWTRHDYYLYPTQNEVDEWLQDKLRVNGMNGLLNTIGMKDEFFVPYM
jgi:hypothetical protein